MIENHQKNKKISPLGRDFFIKQNKLTFQLEYETTTHTHEHLHVNNGHGQTCQDLYVTATATNKTMFVWRYLIQRQLQLQQSEPQKLQGPSAQEALNGALKSMSRPVFI